MFKNFKIGQFWADWQTPQYVQNGPQCRALNAWVGNFFHKTDPLLILILFEKKLKNLQIGQLWADRQTPLFFKTAHKMGPQIHELGIFFIKRPPFNSYFVWEKVETFSNRSIVGRFADPLFFKTARKMWPQIHELGFFYKTDPIWIWILCKKKLKKFQIGPLWADWQTPQYVQNGP